MEGETPYWLGISRVPYIGPKRARLLLSAFGSLREAWMADERSLRGAGLDEKAITSLKTTRAKLDLDLEMRRVTKAGAEIVTQEDARFPALLKQIADAPLLLYVRGALSEADSRALAIVGTRRATPYGRDVVSRLAETLVRHGVTIVSGLAHGIDAIAHRTALHNGGRTIAVLGCGIDQVYPRDHAALAEEMTRAGAIVSEFPIGTKPDAHNFPRRNRIISGLSLGVLIAEAPEQSGALITATAALEQGRDVFAVPGSIFHAASAGTNRLIQEGAKLVQSAEDILIEFDISYQHTQVKRTTERIAPASGAEASVLALLGEDALHVDELVRKSGLPTPDVIATLTLLELKGLARTVAPMQYSLTL